MGCVGSKKIDKEETVRRCRERRRLMNLLLASRAHLASSLFSYLRSLKNTGATLRQFTDADAFSSPQPSSPFTNPHPDETLLPPPPPPLPLLASPTSDIQPQPASVGIGQNDKNGGGDDDDDDDDESCSPPPPPPPVHLSVSSRELWDPFGPPNPSSSDSSSSKCDEVIVDDEDWAEANAEFREDADDEHRLEANNKNAACAENLVSKVPWIEDEVLADDTSSAVSLLTKDTDASLVLWRTNKSLAGIVKEIDDYFLKAAAAGNDVLRILDSHHPHRFRQLEQTNGKSSKSAKVFSALSFNWSFKSPPSSKDACGQEARDVGSSGDHRATLEHLYAKEQMLYKDVKEEELVKVLHRKKTLLLQKLEARDIDRMGTEELRSEIENLHSRIFSLQESINETCLSISKLRDEELRPQLTDLTFGFMQMWRMMYECHQVQNHIAQQSHLLDLCRGLEPTAEAHSLATAQLEAEVTHWYNSFCNLIKSQRNYVQILNQWVGLTDCLPDAIEVTGYANGIHHLCGEWQLSLDRLPDKVAAEAIKSFLAGIHTILVQQKEELNLQKKSNRLESRLEKELTSFYDSVQHEENSVVSGPALAAKLEALKKRVEEEKSKYLNSVRSSRAMMLNNLQTGLPNVFQALMGFAGVCAQAFEGICLPSETTPTGHLGTVPPSFSH